MSVAGCLAAVVDGPDVPWMARKGRSVISTFGGTDVEEALRQGPFRITPDGDRIELAREGRVVEVGELLDIQKAQLFFVS